ncbi:unnamed protein product [Cylindrotheca closterium]|uniref:Uncharacterized protein n=1 Tax=Cylindrotheca closterium TaxID=2856 RepID=A0AAD2CQZ6_9STRA|nr:unnamed protein product [Cylindrotheca closterium]
MIRHSDDATTTNTNGRVVKHRHHQQLQQLFLTVILLAFLPSLASAFTSRPFSHELNHAEVLPLRMFATDPSSSSKRRRGGHDFFPRASKTRQKASLLDDLGFPSSPGWRSDRLNKLTEWADNKTPNRPVVCEYEPDDWWLRRKWTGTVLRMVLRSCLILMGVCAALDWTTRRHVLATSGATWGLFSVPPSTEPMIQSLYGVKKLWEYQLTVTTFILTFFLGHAYSYWQNVYSTTRKIQGRINDFCMLLVMGAKRSKSSPTRNNFLDSSIDGSEEQHSITERMTSNNPFGNSNDDSDDTFSVNRGEFTTGSEELVRMCTRLIRLSHTFFWAAVPTASNGLTDSDAFLEDAEHSDLPIDNQHIGPLLLSTYGLKALVQNSQLTQREAEDLMNTELPPSQYAYVLLVWVGLYTMEGLEKGLLRGGAGFEENIVRQLTTLRATMFDIDDMRAGRMPLAYVQLVQVMVDTLTLLSPFALYPELGSLSIPLVGILTLFFRGLLKLSKSFLDCFGVEGFTGQNIRVDVLVSELNFGAARRWIRAAGRMSGRRCLNVNGLTLKKQL